MVDGRISAHEKIIIDLGTTNSAVAIKKVRVEVLKNAEGEHITPSCVMVRKRLIAALARPFCRAKKNARKNRQKRSLSLQQPEKIKKCCWGK